jgi:hypothetical protein
VRSQEEEQHGGVQLLSIAQLCQELGPSRLRLARPLASPLAVLVSLAELAAAATLIPAFSLRWGAVGALAVLELAGVS